MPLFRPARALFSLRRLYAHACILLCLISVSALDVRAASTPRAGVNLVPPGWPQSVLIHQIGVNAPLESLSLDRAEDVHAPFKWTDVGWYDLGPRPGALGHAVIFGHLDSTCCPAVFWKLRTLVPGDRIQVAYRNGRDVTFQVVWLHTYANTAMPVKWMYGRTLQRGLVVYTCSGTFHTDGSGYDHKLMVYARLLLPNGRLG